MMWLSPERNRGAALELERGYAQRRIQPAPAILVAWVLTRRRFLGRYLARRGRASAAGAAAGRGRLRTAAAVRYPRPIGSWLERLFGIELIFTRNGAALATAVMSFPLMVRAMRISSENVDRGLEEAARTLGAGALDRFATRSPCPHAAGGAGRRHHGVLRGAGRIRRGHHFRLEYSRRDAHAAAGALLGAAGARRRNRGRTPRRSSRSSWGSAVCSYPNGSHAACAACWDR